MRHVVQTIPTIIRRSLPAGIGAPCVLGLQEV